MSHALTHWLQVKHPDVLAAFRQEHPEEPLGIPPAAVDPGWHPPGNAPWLDPEGRDVRPVIDGVKLSNHPDGRPITARDPHPQSPPFTKPATLAKQPAAPATVATENVSGSADEELELATRPARKTGKL